VRQGEVFFEKDALVSATAVFGVPTVSWPYRISPPLLSVFCGPANSLKTPVVLKFVAAIVLWTWGNCKNQLIKQERKKEKVMKIVKTIAALLAVTALNTIAVQAQTGNLFRAQVNLTCKPPQNGKTRMNNQDFIRQCVGDGFTKQEINQNFTLVYNVATDSIEVVNNSDGSLVCEVFQFQGGTNVIGNSQLNRLTFVFVPGNDTAVGSANLIEKSKAKHSSSSITGKIQLSMSEPGATNAVADVSAVVVTNSDGTVTAVGATTTSDQVGNFIESVPVATIDSGVQVCIGSLTIRKQFVPGATTQSTSNKKKKNQQQVVTTTTTTTTTTNETSNVATNITNLPNTANTSGFITNLNNTTTLSSMGF
jgi:hypothetical protein